jgi:hypothetical protein
LESVRQRLRRRRRRRAAGLSVTAVLAVAAAGLLLPGTLGAGGTPPRAAGSTSGLPGTGAPPASEPLGPAPTADDALPGASVWQPSGLDGLRFEAPAGWHVLAPAGEPAAYLSNQTLALPQGGCEHQLDGFCTPLARSLNRGGVLVQIRLTKKLGMPTWNGPQNGPGTTAEPTQLLDACRSVGGTEQLAGVVAGPTPGPALATVTVCLAHPTAAQRAQARAVAAAARFA